MGAWREGATHVALVAIVVIGMPISLYFVTEQASVYPWTAKWIGMSLYGAAVGTACLRRLNYRWRALVLLASLYALAAEQLLLGGLAGNGRILLLLIPLLALVLLGTRAGWIAALLGALTVALFTVLAGNGKLERWQVIHENSVDLWPWFLQAMSLLGALIPLMILLTGFLNLQRRTMLAERQARWSQVHFSRQLIHAQETERRRVAGELHDGLGQDLLVIANQAQLGLLKTGGLPDLALRFTEMGTTAKQALQQVRRLAHNLRPGLLEELGFTGAVEASVEKAGQASEISLKLNLANVDGLLPPEFEVNLFRILQEALNNILKHAAATHVAVTLAHDASALRLIVEDNGCGLISATPSETDTGPRGLGLRQMAERAGMMDGRLNLQSLPGQGTRLVVEVPLKDSPDSA